MITKLAKWIVGCIPNEHSFVVLLDRPDSYDELIAFTNDQSEIVRISMDRDMRNEYRGIVNQLSEEYALQPGSRQRFLTDIVNVSIDPPKMGKWCTFHDLKCPICGAEQSALNNLLKPYEEEVRDLPLATCRNWQNLSRDEKVEKAKKVMLQRYGSLLNFHFNPRDIV